MRIGNWIILEKDKNKELLEDRKKLEKRFEDLGLDKIFMAVNISDKEWGAIHCQGVLTGYRLCLEKLGATE